MASFIGFYSFLSQSPIHFLKKFPWQCFDWYIVDTSVLYSNIPTTDVGYILFLIRKMALLFKLATNWVKPTSYTRRARHFCWPLNVLLATNQDLRSNCIDGTWLARASPFFPPLPPSSSSLSLSNSEEEIIYLSGNLLKPFYLGASARLLLDRNSRRLS